MQPPAIPTAPIRQGLALSLVLHVLVAVIAWFAVAPPERSPIEVVDIEVAPAAPQAEALGAERKRLPDDEPPAKEEAATPDVPTPGEGLGAVDAGVDAPIDAPPRRKPPRRADAGIDAAEMMASTDDDDAGVDDGGTAVAIAADDAGTDGDAGVAVTGTDDAGVATGTSDEVAVDGAPTTAGTAANLLTYFPRGHKLTVLIRFDCLRGTDWLALTERLLKPMPDYRRLFGAADAQVGQKLDMLIISTPAAQSAIATTLVAKTNLARAQLRTFLEAGGTVAWSPVRGGLLGKRTGGNLFPGDQRVFLSPFKGWFLLAQPRDLPNLTAAAPGNLDAVQATVKLPAWLASIRQIEQESGTEVRGPALVLTMDLGGKRVDLGQTGDFGLGVKSFPMPERISVAAEVVRQGWIIRGNMKFASTAAADEFVATATNVKQRIADSMALQLAVGKPVARIVANLSFAKAADRVSYATSVSISDMQAIMAVATQLLDAHFAGK